jgi:hypothetical protein
MIGKRNMVAHRNVTFAENSSMSATAESMFGISPASGANSPLRDPKLRRCFRRFHTGCDVDVSFHF